MTTINNDWITLHEEVDGQIVPILYKGSREITIQRKFAGLDTFINENNEVTRCDVKYWQRELYPNGDIIKCELKYYSLQDLSETINDIEQWRQEPLPVLTGFINSLGYPGIINPARETLMNHLLLEVSSPDGEALRNKIREKLPLN